MQVIVIDGPNLNSLCSSKNVDMLVADDSEIRNLAVKRQNVKRKIVAGTYSQWNTVPKRRSCICPLETLISGKQKPTV